LVHLASAHNLDVFPEPVYRALSVATFVYTFALLLLGRYCRDEHDNGEYLREDQEGGRSRTAMDSRLFQSEQEV